MAANIRRITLVMEYDPAEQNAAALGRSLGLAALVVGSMVQYPQGQSLRVYPQVSGDLHVDISDEAVSVPF